MFTRIQQVNGLTLVAHKAAFSVRNKLINLNTNLIVVLIILVLLTQSGVGLIA
jgi:hypothetical protein